MSFEDEQRRKQEMLRQQREAEINRNAAVMDEAQRLRGSQVGENVQGLFEPQSGYDARLMDLAKQNLVKKAALEQLKPRVPVMGPERNVAIMGTADMYQKMRQVDALTPEEREQRAKEQEDALEAKTQASDARFQMLRNRMGQ